MVQVRNFGQFNDGVQVQACRLDNGCGLRADILNLGGILARLELALAGQRVNLVLGLPDARAYHADPAYLGILVGRYANRIAAARFPLGGHVYRLTTNEGRHHLHGGSLGFGRRRWSIQSHVDDALVLHYRSPDGEEGYPGTLDVTATYCLQGRRLHLCFEAQCDAPTPFNPTHHPYFNLAGDPAVPADAQWLRVPADGYLPVDDELIPLGEIADVTGTPFDFRQAASLAARHDNANAQLLVGGGYDHCLILQAQHNCMAELYSPHSGVAMRIVGDAPALQLYGGHGLDALYPHLGRGLCLEPQDLPDAPNRTNFPDATLHPGQHYCRRIEYRFALPGRGCDWAQVTAALDCA